MSADRLLSGPGAEGAASQSQGRLIGRRYRLMSPVGRGGMGMVWHAHDVLLDRAVAVKELILPFGLDHAGKQVAHRRMLREARSAARLTHPGIITVHDVVEEDGRPWIVMELVRAWSLEQAVRQSGPLPVIQAAEIGIRVLDALSHAHAAGILHRDIKPGNVLLTADRVVLTDFGIAAIEGDVTITQTGLLMGSPAYIPPERLSGQQITQAADLWSFGATMYAAVEGRPPYDGPDAIAVLGAVLTQDPIRPQRAGALLPVIEGLLRKDPAQRISAAQVSEMLEKVLRAHGSHPPRGQETPGLPTQADSTPVGLLPPLEPPSGPMPSRIVETPSGPVRVPYDPLTSPSGGYVMPYDGLSSPSGAHSTQQIGQPPADGFDAFSSPSGPYPSGDALDTPSGAQRIPYSGPPGTIGNPAGSPHSGVRNAPSGPFEAPSGGVDAPSGGFDASSSGAFERPSGGFDAPSGAHERPFDAFDQPSGGFDAPSGGFDAPSGGFDAPSGGFDAPSGSHRMLADAPSGPHSRPDGPSGPRLGGLSGQQPTFGGPSGPQPILPLTSDSRGSAPWPLASPDDLREQSRDLSRDLGGPRTAGTRPSERLTRSRRRPAESESGRTRGGRPTPRLIITVVATVGAAAAAVLFLTSGGSSTPEPATTTAQSPVAQPTVATVPDDYDEHTAPGFTVAVPKTWKLANPGGVATFTGPKDSGMKITVQQAAPQTDGGVSELSKEEADGGVEGYIQVQLQALDFRGWKAADWEYTYTLPNGVPMHALTRYVTLDDTTAFKITFDLPELKWDDQAKLRQVFLDTFRPSK